MSTDTEIPPSSTKPKRLVPTSGAWRNAVFAGLGSLLGILIAFSIDAWWDAKGERARERGYLVALRSELSQARSAVLEHKATLQGDIETGRRIVAILSAPAAAALSTDSVIGLDRMGPLQLFTPPRAALDDVIHSGGLTLIRSDSLRRMLASYEQALARDLNEQETVSDIWLSHLAPYRYQHSTLERLVSNRFETPDLGYGIDRAAFVQNRTYANILLARVLRVRNVTASHDSITSQIDKILPILKAY